MSWIKEVVDAAAHVGMYPSLKVDASDTLHVAYFDNTQSMLKYARKKTGNSWSATTIASAQFKDQISLALDSNAFPYVAFTDPSDFYLKIAHLVKSNNPSSPWVWSTNFKIEQYVDYAYCSLAVVSDGTMHVSYMLKKGVPTDKYVLAYAKAKAHPVTEEITSNGHRGLFTSIAVDSNGIPHISYYDFDGKNLWYSRRFGQTGWTLEQVDSPGDVGQGTSIALDANGLPHIAYYDASNENLRYAVKTATNLWKTGPIDSQGSVGLNPSLALDSFGRPHVSYYDATNKTLKYAKLSLVTTQGSALPWSKETVDSTGDAGRYSSICLDSGGYAHICYYDAANQCLKHAKHS